MTNRLLRFVGAGLLAMSGLVLAASPAHAGTPTFEFLSPTNGQTLRGADATFHLRVRMESSDGRLQGNVRVDFGVPSGAPGIAPIERNAQDQRSIDITQPLTMRWNGTYRADARAAGRNNVLDGDTAPRTAGAAWIVDALPAVPANVRTAVDEDTRVVTVTWSRNTEPDLIGYEVQKRASNGDWVHFTATADASVRDESTQYAGGTYRYRVAAVRRAADSRFANRSAFTETSATVPAPPVGTPPPEPEPDPEREQKTGGQTGGSGGGSGGSSGGTVGGGFTSEGRRGSAPFTDSSGKVGLSDFERLLAEADRQNRPPGEAPEPDGTYDPNLPFAGREGDSGDGDDGGEEAGDGPVMGIESGDDVTGRLQSLGFLAGGLLATVLAMHVLWLRNEVHRADKEAGVLPAEAPEPRPPVSAEARFGYRDVRHRADVG